MQNYRDTHSEEDRSKESSRLKIKFPDRVPIICERNCKSSVPVINKTKYLVPKDFTISEFACVIRRRLKLKSTEAIFLLVGEMFLSGSLYIGEIYEEHKDIDNFLYISYSSENVFGSI